MATKYSDYDYKSDANAVLNAKIGWNLATTDEERQKQNQIANSARDRLKAYGYSDLADQISAGGADATQTRQIIENYSKPKTTAPVETNNLKSTEVNRENAGVFDKYNNFWDESVNVDPFETSYGKAIMGKYDLAALQGRDNAVASGGASNGGNIDSYAAANAMRQQASLISQGQSAVLDAYQKRIDSARGYLSDMGVNIDRVFNQDETAKNNDVARKSEIASVTGYVPNEWTYDNNTYLNKDGTVKDIYLTDEFDNSGGFETIINDAKSKLATTTDATERANLEATIYYAQQAKNIKTEQNPTKYGKYASSVRAVSPLKTATVLKDERDNDTVLKSLGIESADKRYEIDANNQNKIDVVGAETQGQKEILTHTKELQGNGGDIALSDDANKVAKLIMNKVNDWAKANHSVSVIDDLGRNTYKFNLPKGHDLDWWDDIVFQYIDESTLTEDEAAIFINQLGLSAYWNDWLKKTGKLTS